MTEEELKEMKIDVASHTVMIYQLQNKLLMVMEALCEKDILKKKDENLK